MALPCSSVQSYSERPNNLMIASGETREADEQCSLSNKGQPVSALKLLRKHRNREQSNSRLFLLLHQGEGGVLPLELGITEIAGLAGCGKTQIGLGLCVSCAMQRQREETGTENRFTGNAPASQIRHRHHTALYVSLGEGTTQARVAQRLHQMAAQRCIDPGDVLKCILTRFIRNEDEFLMFIMNELPLMFTQSSIGVIVLDSIAALFRVSQTRHTSTTYAKRSGVLFQVAAQLKLLSDLHQVPIVVINQVTTSLEANKVIPALGVSWASCVNASYMLSRTEGTCVRAVVQSEQRENQPMFMRTISLVRSSSSAPLSVSFRIVACGAIVAD